MASQNFITIDGQRKSARTKRNISTLDDDVDGVETAQSAALELVEATSPARKTKKNKISASKPPKASSSTSNDEIHLSFWYEAIQDKDPVPGKFYHDKSVSCALTSAHSAISVSAPISFEDVQTWAARVYKATYGRDYDADGFFLGLILPSTSDVQGRKKKFQDVQILSRDYLFTNKIVYFLQILRDLSLFPSQMLLRVLRHRITIPQRLQNNKEEEKKKSLMNPPMTKKAQQFISHLFLEVLCTIIMS
jgi:hypothetical protein